MRILAIDPATHCGFAIGGRSGVEASGTWDLSPKRDESKGMRLVRFRSKLDAAVGNTAPAIVVFEAARAAGGHAGALVVQSEIQGVLKLYLEEAGIEYRGYSSTEIKKHATGKGNAKKDAMVEAARKRWPNCEDDNEADALWLLDLALSEYAGGDK